jgi:hypothetical protein
MSFDLYIQCFENGEPAGLSRDLIRKAFGASVSEPEENYWQLVFGARDSCSLSLSPLEQSEAKVHNITVERPCSDARFWQGLARLLTHGHTVLYFPGCSGPLLFNPSAAGHMPPDMLEALGDPVIVTSGADILRSVAAA